MKALGIDPKSVTIVQRPTRNIRRVRTSSESWFGAAEYLKGQKAFCFSAFERGNPGEPLWQMQSGGFGPSDAFFTKNAG